MRIPSPALAALAAAFGLAALAHGAPTAPPVASASTAPRAHAVVGGTTPGERAVLARVTAAGLERHMRFLADDLLEGRGTGTRGHALAALYVANVFAAEGLTPGGKEGGWFQPVPFMGVKARTAECALVLTGDGRESKLAFGEDYVMPGDYLRDKWTTDAHMTFAGYGVTAPELGYDDYAGLDVKDKVVVILSGAPRAFDHDARAFHSWGQTKEQTAAAHGAIGIFTFRTPDDERRAPWPRVVRQSRLGGMKWTFEDGAPHDVRPTLEAAATLSHSGAAALFEGAPHGLDEVFATADSGTLHGFDLPVMVHVRRATDRIHVTSPNVIAVVPGSDPRLRREVVVFSAHLDHLGIGTTVNGDSIHNGAFDNASGSAMLLEMAGALRRMPVAPRRTTAFVAVTGEEKGLQGSDYFAQYPTLPGAIVADVNVDMFLMLHPLHDVVAFGAEHSTLGAVIARAARDLGVAVTADPHPEEVEFVRSDQFSFVRQGVPALFPVGGPGAGPADQELDATWRKTIYHSPQDDMGQTMDFGAGEAFARLALLAGLRIANATVRPAWNPGDYFGVRFGHVAEVRATR